MRKTISVLLAAIMTIGVFTSCKNIENKQDITESYTEEPVVIKRDSNEEYDYSILSDNTVVIDSYNGSEAKVDIPNEIENLPVKSIGDIAFICSD